MLKRIALPCLFALTFIFVPTAVHAQRKSPLADAPAIRKRVELRESRFEITPGIGSTVNDTFYQSLLFDAHLAYHFNDWLSIAGLVSFDITDLSTGFRDRLNESLTSGMQPARTPTLAATNRGLNKMGLIAGGRAEVTPFTGKYSLFGKLFAHYDFYVFGGGAYVSFTAKNGGTACTGTLVRTTPDASCVASGGQPGILYGGGIHTYFNDFVALNLEVRDILVKDNPAGRDVNGDGFVSTSDLTWSSHLIALLGVTVYLPIKADISP